MLRDQALHAAKSACLNYSEGAGRVTRADRARAHTVARGEAVEAVPAAEIAVLGGNAKADALPEVVGLGNELFAVLTALVRRRGPR